MYLFDGRAVTSSEGSRPGGEPIVIVVGIEVETDKGITASAVANADSKSKTYTDNSAVQAKSHPLTEEQQNTMNNEVFAKMKRKS